MYNVKSGFPKLGNMLLEDGTNFGIISKSATRVKINFFKNEDDIIPYYSFELNSTDNKTDDIWHVFICDLPEKTFYTWNIDGPKLEDSHFNYFNHLTDPYSTSNTKQIKGVPMKSITLKRSFNRNKNYLSKYRMSESIIYELHIGLFTRNSNSNVKLPGTYSGIIEKIPHLKNLGITAVEFLPVMDFDNNGFFRNPLTKEKLKNIWGYNSISFFALSKYYSSSSTPGDEIAEFKNLVSKLHEADIEVILDVVYNHTAEGGEGGPIYNFKGMDNSAFYILSPDKKRYLNFSGTGNTLNCNSYESKNVILDSLRYWHLEIGIDGFRFDLAAILGRNSNGEWIGSESIISEIANDPLLSKAKLIAESWDAGGGYFLGGFPKRWSEWNGKYRDCVRKFVRGDEGQLYDFLNRFLGSPDLFNAPKNSVNFITCHDGFTMMDLVSYNCKHNLENGEYNQDGENNNFSCNYGYEGITDSPALLNFRKRQIKNFMSILFLSQGVPMLLMGDEIGRTQFGNNNAYSQNSQKVWVDWSNLPKFKDIYFFIKSVISFRKKHPILQNGDSFIPRDNTRTIEDYSYSTFGDFSYYSSSFAIRLNDHKLDYSIFLIFNFSNSTVRFELPKPEKNKDWHIVLDTSKPSGIEFYSDYEKLNDLSYDSLEKSIVLFISKSNI